MTPNSTTPATVQTVTLPIEPGQTPDEEAELVARVAAAVVEDTGAETVNVELIQSEHVTIAGSVADRMQGAARWSA
jgi:phenylpyruvate tautomerase PptA (4-oxalocrotonate tautomerase family)